MEVHLIWKTPDAEKLILYMARVSNPPNQHSKNTKLITYLTEHKHWSPLDMADICVEIVTSRAIAAQLLRHRSAYFQEFSQRYAEVQAFEPVALRKQASKNRQSSTESFDPIVRPAIEEIDIDARETWYTDSVTASEQIQATLEYCRYTYDLLLKAGVAKECARMVLPLTTQTRLYMKNTVRNWIFYIALRTQEDTQKEHRAIAESIKAIFIQEFPIISKALHWIGDVKNERP